MSVNTVEGESNTFTTNNDFRFIGVVRDPLLANGSAATATAIDQSHRIEVNGVVGDFIADEVITGSTSGAKGRLIYFANTNAARANGVLKLVRLTTNGTGGGFSVGETVTGGTSTITGKVVSVTKPALTPYSGIVIYSENRIPLQRGPLQTEKYRITIKY